VKLSKTDKQEADLFVKNAHFLFAHKCGILCCEQMFFARVPIISGLAYTGPFREPVLGSYIEWWMACTASHIDDALVYKLSGSPLSGANACSIVTPDGESKTYHAPKFMGLVRTFMPINRRCARCNDCKDAFTIREVVEKLSDGPNRIIDARY